MGKYTHYIDNNTDFCTCFQNILETYLKYSIQKQKFYYKYIKLWQYTYDLRQLETLILPLPMVLYVACYTVNKLLLLLMY